MKYSNRHFGIFFILIITGIPTVFAQVNRYDLNATGDGIVLKLITGGDRIVIPETIEGYPVVEIGGGDRVINGTPTEIVLPRTVRKIGANAFFDCRRLVTINFPSGLKEIGNNAFQYCRNLVSIDLPEGLEIIGSSAFDNCEKLNSIKFPSSLREISYGAFAMDGFRTIEVGPIELIFPEGIEVIGVRAFQNRFLIKTIVFPNSIKEIREGAFNSCFELTDILIPDTLTSIRFPKGSWFVNNDAFSNCGKIKLAARRRLQDLGYPGSF